MPAPAFRYLIGVAAVGISILLRLALAPFLGDKFVYILYFPAVMFSAWYGGLGPGLLATMLTALYSATYLLPPVLTLQIHGAANALSLVIFVLIGVFISALNESARREKAAARLAGQQLRVTLASIGDGVIATNREGRITFMNAVAASLTGWTARQSYGRPIGEVVHLIDEGTREPVQSAVGRALSDRRAVEHRSQLLLVARDGTERPIEERSAPMVAPDGELTGAVFVFDDITERREREFDLQFALSAGRMATWTNDPLTGRVSASPEMAGLHGVSAEDYEQYQGPEYFEYFVHPDDRGRLRQAVAHALATASPHEIEYRVVWPDGSVHWLLGMGRTRVDGTGRAVAFGGVCIDITALKQTQSREQFLAEASRVLGSSLDYRETLARVTELAVPEIADWCAVDMIGEDDLLERLAVTHPDPEKARLAYESAQRWPVALSSSHALAQVIRTGTSAFAPQLTDAMIAQGAREPQQVKALIGLGLRSAIVVPLQARGRMLGAISLAMAESGRTYTETDLRLMEELARRASIAIDNARLFADAESANQAKDEFLARLSHELRTPLNAILGWTLMLRTTDARDRLARGLDVIDRNGRALTRIIEDLLDFSRNVRGGLRVDRVPVDMRPIVAEAIDSVDVMVRQKKLRLEWHPNSVCRVLGDAARLQQVVWNLLTNAIKFTPEGGSVHVSLATLPEAAELRVTDSGVGIRPEILDTIFNPFQQGERHGTPGLGLGLAIVRQVVEAHDGTVLAESAGLNRGATLIVRLPRLTE
jgi:PAS domain S-box-containing protein